jgi:hypothetical protein
MPDRSEAYSVGHALQSWFTPPDLEAVAAAEDSAPKPRFSPNGADGISATL